MLGTTPQSIKLVSNQSCVFQTKRSGDDFVVRNGDFFSAVHLIMSNKHSRLRRDETLKVSHSKVISVNITKVAVFCQHTTHS